MYGEERRMGIAAIARHSRRWLTRSMTLIDERVIETQLLQSQDIQKSVPIDLDLNRQDPRQMPRSTTHIYHSCQNAQSIDNT